MQRLWVVEGGGKSVGKPIDFGQSCKQTFDDQVFLAVLFVWSRKILFAEENTPVLGERGLDTGGKSAFFLEVKRHSGEKAGIVSNFEQGPAGCYGIKASAEGINRALGRLGDKFIPFFPVNLLVLPIACFHP